ncbi:hypothetical protein GCM10029963_76360 [Micromonospora andamanensis]
MTTNAAVRGGDTRLTRVVDTYLSAWSEPDPVRRLEMIAGCWVDDGALVDPPLDGRGHAGISTLMATMQQHYPGHAFVRTTEVDLHHDTFRVGWELRGPGVRSLSQASTTAWSHRMAGCVGSVDSSPTCQLVSRGRPPDDHDSPVPDRSGRRA